MTKEEIMQRLVDRARRNLNAPDATSPVMAFVTLDGEIVGEGANSVVRDRDPTAHAEVAAIRDACRRLQKVDLSDCELYTLMDPCPMCFAAIYMARLSRFYYGTTRADAVRLGFGHRHLFRDAALPTEQRTFPTERLMGEEAVSIVDEWSRSPGFEALREANRPQEFYCSTL